MTDRIRILGRKLISKGYGALERLTLVYRRRDGREQLLERELFDTGDGAAILLYDPARGMVALVRQFRLPAFVKEGREALIEVCAGRLEGWTTRQRGPLTPKEIRPVTYEEFRKLQDMARDDLAFFAAPAAGQGTAEYKGLTEVAGRATHAVHYAYASGFRITRHFDAKTFALVASDQLTPTRELIRQQVVSFVEVDGLRFAAKETITVEGRKSGEVTYGKIQVNPALTPGLFDFPSF